MMFDINVLPESGVFLMVIYFLAVFVPKIIKSNFSNKNTWIPGCCPFYSYHDLFCYISSSPILVNH